MSRKRTGKRNALSVREIDKGRGWKVREVMGETVGDRKTFYYYKGKIAPRIPLKSRLAKQLAGYTLIEKDLRNVLNWLLTIEALLHDDEGVQAAQRDGGSIISPDRKRFDTVKGLFVAALTFYGKCFTQCEGRKLQLDKKIMDADYREKHEEVMAWRNSYAAHSGADNFEVVKIALVLPPRIESNEPPEIYRELTQPDFMDTIEEGEVNFKSLAEHVKAKVEQKMRVVTNKILTEEIAPMGKEYWYRQPRE